MKNIFFLSSLAFIAITLNSCNRDLRDFDVAYKVTMQSTWTASSHPVDYPSDAHFSPFYGMAHSDEAALYEVFTMASPGIQEMAETGKTGPLTEEIENYLAGNEAVFIIEGSRIDGDGSESDKFGIDMTHPYVSIVSMIAPSPDWFVGVRNVKLFDNGSWIENLTVNASAYDAGTDSGSTFTSPDEVTDPQGIITLITSTPLAEEGVVPTMATFTFERIK